MENNNVNTNTTATPVNTTAEQPQQHPHRRRESGNFRGQTPIKDFRELDPQQFPQRPREERVPMWAQQLQKSIDLLSQEQEKLKQKIEALPSKAPESYDDSKLSAAVAELKKLCEEQFLKVRDNQKHSHENVMAGLKDICCTLTSIHESMQPKAKRNLMWKIFHPIQALKEWWQRKSAERRQRREEKLKEQLKALQAKK